MADNTLIVITGPTASGKTKCAIDIASQLGCEIISADSRQLYKGIPIVTAAPTADELAAVPHHFVQTLVLTDYYSAAMFEQEALKLLPELFRRSGGYAVVCGGSMMYIDALTHGIDQLPTISPQVRTHVQQLLSAGGTDAVISELKGLDPEFLASADLKNHKRLAHALEICLEASAPYSSLCTGRAVERPFKIITYAITPERSVLFDRINRRVDAMVESGLEDEARSVYHLRHLNSLNTVGLKEMFAYFDGAMDRTTAIERIKKNTRVYAKKQLTWLQRPGHEDVVKVENASDINLI